MSEKKPKIAPRQKATGKGIIMAALITAALLVWLTMLTWNRLVPPVFGGPPITFIQALLLWLLPNLVLYGFPIIKWVAR